MNEQRAVAGAILDKAKVAVTTVRGQQHGDAESSFAAIGEMWVAYLNAAAKRRFGIQLVGLNITATDVAFMMGHVKEMRVMYGDEADPDNYLDQAGYVALAGSFHVPADRMAPAKPSTATQPEPIPTFLSIRDGMVAEAVQEATES